MPPKRKADISMPNYRERKKVKLAATRAIPVQSVTPGASTSNSLAGLPPSLDVERFTETRAFEITAMEDALRNSRFGKNARAMQQLPRHMRRRTASHDPKRVPQRLREKAKAEMDNIKPKKKPHKPQLGKEKRVSRTETFLKRQRDKLWLETHIWHAKRMHMENMWGYRLGITPTEKSFRPSHRASVHGSIIHDASYFGTLELRGPQSALIGMLETCCDPQGPSLKAIRYLNGSRIYESQIYRHSYYPFNLLGPISIIWRPDSTSSPTSASNEKGNTKDKAKGKGKEKETGTAAATEEQTISTASSIRTVWLRLHPTIFNDVFTTLQESLSFYLQLARSGMANDTPAIEVEMTDLRNKITAFEIMGPKANQILRGSLTPVLADKRESFTEFWATLGDIQTTASCPLGMIVGFTVLDPRLKFPPHNAKPQNLATTPQTVRPSKELAESDIWSESTRDRIAKPRYKKKDIDARRAKHLIPGTKLNALRQDDRIPCILIQKSLCSSSDTQGIHGWTILLPSGWAMAFWSSIIFTGTRVGGQRERQTQSFESGISYFPRDYPLTQSCNDMIENKGGEEMRKWERTPNGKKPNYSKLGTRSPWVPDWDVVLGLREHVDAGGGFVTTQREPQAKMDSDIRLWLLLGPNTRSIVQECLKSTQPGIVLLGEINLLRIKKSMQPLEHGQHKEGLIKGALVRVRLKMVNRGSSEDMACIYMLDDEKVKMSLDGKMDDDMDVSDYEEGEDSFWKSQKKSKAPYPSESIIGYVTSGNFSLSRGQSHAIGAMPLLKYLEIAKQATRLSTGHIVGVRNRHEREMRAAYVEVVQD